MSPRVLLKRTGTKQRAQGPVSEGSLNIFYIIYSLNKNYLTAYVFMPHITIKEMSSVGF
jgi:hypothetical protein